MLKKKLNFFFFFFNSAFVHSSNLPFLPPASSHKYPRSLSEITYRVYRNLTYMSNRNASDQNGVPSIVFRESVLFMLIPTLLHNIGILNYPVEA